MEYFQEISIIGFWKSTKERLVLTFWFQLLKKFSMKCVLGIKIEEKKSKFERKIEIEQKDIWFKLGTWVREKNVT